MTAETPIKDFTFYNAEMEKGMKDKLYFLKFLEEKVPYQFIDFGCANGKTLEAISNVRHNPLDTYVGYDDSSEMIQLAKSQWEGPRNNNVFFCNDWDKIKVHEQNSVLILSSVLHEVYSYCTNEEIEAFWKRVLNSGVEYIAIRDMCWSRDMDRFIENFKYEKGAHVINDIYTPFIKFKKAVNMDDDDYRIIDFEKQWGSLNNVKNFLHFLLKYRYTLNWEREVKENYFALLDKELLTRTVSYNINYLERFQLPTIKQFTQPDTLVTELIKDNTHIKLFLKRKIKHG